MSGRYNVWLSDALGNHIASLNDFESLTYTRVRNAPGVLKIVLPPTISYNLIKNNRDARIEVYRGLETGPMNLDTNTIWFVDLDEQDLDVSGGYGLTLTAHSAMDLLRRRIVAYYAGSGQAAKTGLADDVMKAIVRENLGSLATDTSRDMSTYMSVQIDNGLGPTVTKQFARRTVLTVLQEISDAAQTAGTTTYFDIVSPTPATLEFRTFIAQRGTDRTYPKGSNPVLLAPQFGNYSQPKLTRDYTNEVNYVYAGGQGNLDQRAVVTSIDSTRTTVSPFSRREVFRSAVAAQTPAQLQMEADDELRAGIPATNLAGVLNNTPQTQYGRHWFFGDKLSAYAFNERIDIHVHAVTVTVAKGGVENIQAELRYV